jgi:hypothetical protein
MRGGLGRFWGWIGVVLVLWCGAVQAGKMSLTKQFRCVLFTCYLFPFILIPIIQWIVFSFRSSFLSQKKKGGGLIFK